MYDVETLFKSIELKPVARGMAGLSSGEPYVMSVESPVPGVSIRSATVRVKGWIFSRGASLTSLVIKGPAREWTTPVDRPRADVVAIARQRVPDVEFPVRCGFDETIVVPGAEEFALELIAVLADGSRVPLAKLGATVSGAPCGIVIAGFHRSGTSLLGAILENAGVHLGNELVPPALSNPNGHFEDCWAVDIDSAMLNASDNTWQVESPSSIHPTSEHREALQAYVRRRSIEGAAWAVKDPRAGVVAREWLAAAQNIRIVVPVRGAGSTASSLRQRAASEIVRNPFEPDSGRMRLWLQPDLPFELWCAHHESLVALSQSHPGSVTFLDHGAVVENPVGLAQDLLGLATSLAGVPVRKDLISAPDTADAWRGISPSTMERVRALQPTLGIEMIPGGSAEGDADERAAANWNAIESLLGEWPFDGPLHSAPVVPGGTDAISAARAAITRHDWKAALHALADAWVEQGRRGELARLQADVLMQLGRWREALSLLSARTSGAEDAEALAAAGECLLVLGRADEAKDVIRTLAAMRIAQPWAWQRAARTATRLNDPQLSDLLAQGMERNAVLTNPDWVAVMALWEMRRGNLSKGERLLAEAGPLMLRDSPLLREARVEQRLRQGDTGGARRLVLDHLLASSDRGSYTARLKHLADSLGNTEMKADFLERVFSELNKLRPAAPRSPEAPHPQKAPEGLWGFLKRLAAG